MQEEGYMTCVEITYISWDIKQSMNAYVYTLWLNHHQILSLNPQTTIKFDE